MKYFTSDWGVIESEVFESSVKFEWASKEVYNIEIIICLFPSLYPPIRLTVPLKPFPSSLRRKSCNKTYFIFTKSQCRQNITDN